jgi:hypothetical protein
MNPKLKIGLTLLAMSLIIASLVCVASVSSTQTATVSLSPSTISGGSLGIGGTFTVTAQVSQVTNLWAWSLALSWDPAVLSMQDSITEGAFLKTAGSTMFVAAPINNQNGRVPSVADVLLTANGATGSGNLVSFTFQVVGHGSTQITLSGVELDDPNSQVIPSTIVNAQFSYPDTSGGYSLTFSETGLPSGQSWSVALNGGSPQGSTSATDVFSNLAVGTYNYVVTAPTGYTVNPSQGSVTISTSSRTENIVFSASSGFSFTFSESGLLSGTSWSVTCGGTTLNSNGASSIVFSGLSAQQYSFTVNAVTGYTASPSQGTITVSGSGQTQNIVFTGTSGYSFTFSESGLPSGVSWSVTCGGTAFSASAPSSIVFSGLSAQQYSYTVSTITGYTASPNQGTITVSGSGGSQAITFTTSSTYSLTFHAIGLGSGVSWSVTLGGTTYTANAPSDIVFSGLSAQQYSYTVNAVTGYAANPSQGSVTISTASQTLNVVFTPTSTYSLTFHETGLVSGQTWTVTTGGMTYSANAPSDIVVSGLAVGPYSYTVGSITGYAANPSQGSVTISTSSQTVNVAFSTSSTTYSFTFTQTGLPSGQSWSVTLNGGSPQGSTSTTNVFNNLVPASYSYVVMAPSGYTASPSQGQITVSGSGQSQAIVFTASAQTYTYTFTESGLPTGTSWSVNLAGTTLSTTTSAITFTGLAAGQYSYSVTALSGYTVYPSQGTITVSGSGQQIVFSSSTQTYSFTFSETGLPSGQAWSVALNGGTPQGSTSSTDVFSNLAASTYSYVVTAPSGYTANPSQGQITVTSSGQSQAITFSTSSQQYSFTFIETGLPSGTSWSINLGGTTLSSTTSAITFSGLSAQQYSYTVSAVSGYTASPFSGTVTLTGSGQTQTITFATGSLVSLNFHETGLPAGTLWSVTCNGQTVQSTVPDIYISLTTGNSYPYTVGAVTGYSANPSSGTVTAAGSGQTVTITFAASYSFVFHESGLPSGTSWNVTCNGQTIVSTSADVTFSSLATGSYSYSVGALAGYEITPSTGTITVNSAGQSQAITFTNVRDVTKVDVFTDKGGRSAGTNSDAYGPQELIKIYAFVTYRDAPVVNKDVAFSIRNQNGDLIDLRVARTNTTGYAYADYRLPWPDSSTPEVMFGTWSIVGSVDVSQIVVTDNIHFVFNYLINTNGIQMPAAVQRQSSTTVSITIQSISNSAIWSSVSITVYDEAKVPISYAVINNPSQTTGSSIITATLTIPSWAYIGKATVYVDVLTGPPSAGGVPYCPEKIANFQILP